MYYYISSAFFSYHLLRSSSMEVKNGSLTFNKRKAEGRDKNDKSKKGLQLKRRKLNPVNTLCYLQILGTGMDTHDTSPSVLLFFDKQRFVFNAGEGLQRFCTEHKIKLSKIDHIFLSRVCSETTGGLPGLLLTLAGIGDEGMSVNVWGPSNLKSLVDAMKCFIPKKAIVHTRSFGPDHSAGGLVSDSLKSANPIILIDDEVVRISALLLRPGNGMPKPDDISVVYVCELPEIIGKFDPAKAASLGLKPGPKYRELQLGNSVKSDRLDIMIHPSDVMDRSIPGPIVIIVDCPTMSHVSELLTTESLTPFYTDSPDYSPEDARTVNCIVHLTPSSISNDTLYQKWMKRFGSAQHIMAGHRMKNIEIPILKASARIAARLNHICPYFFPAPGFWSCHDTTDGVLAPCEGNKYCKSKPAENLLKFHLRPIPQLGLDRSSVPSLMDPSRIIDELSLEIPEVDDAAREISQLWQDKRFPIDDIISTTDNNLMIEDTWLNGSTLPSCLENITREDMEIVLLGTGSSQPSKYRNVTSNFINLFSKGSLLLDCGEGTLGQLKRRYGVQGADDAIRGLRCIWISHIHADHHTGLARILALRRQLLQNVPHKPLLVIGPNQLKQYLDAYERLEDLDMQFLDCRHTTEASLVSFMEGFESNGNLNIRNGAAEATQTQNVDDSLFSSGSLKYLKEVLAESGIESLISVPVIHCDEAFGVVIKAANRTNSLGKLIPGWKVVFSGDTRPCPKLTEAAKGATILIHEATFEDGLWNDAKSKNHSTTKEAIKVGEDAGAYRIILTHFSQRYPKVPVFDKAYTHKTCIAFDMMSVNIADLPVLPKILPYLKLLFKNEFLIGDESEVENAVTG